MLLDYFRCNQAIIYLFELILQPLKAKRKLGIRPYLEVGFCMLDQVLPVMRHIYLELVQHGTL